MKHDPSRVLLLMLIALGLAGCVPATPPGTSSFTERAAAPDQSRILRVVLIIEPEALTGGGGATRVLFARRMFIAGLAAKGSHDAPYPVLAEGLPQLNTDMWKVFPDGRMETIYRLRPGLTWHDGRPLTAADFAFSLRAVKAEAAWGSEPPGLADDRKSAAFMDEIVALDSQFLVIRWPQPYPGAGALPFLPLPRHLLESWVDENNADAYHGRDYWTTAYVGVGPYRLVNWERGAFIEGAAFDGYALGRPKIDRIIVTFSDKPTTTVARLLADDVDMAANGSIGFQETTTLRQQWVQRTQGRILLNPTEVQMIDTQQRPAYADPTAMLDVKTRQALLHAIDRPALAEAMVGDPTMVAEAMVPSNVGFYAAVDRAITKYPFDITRAEQLMREVGFIKAADGVLVNAATGRFSASLLSNAGGQDERSSTIVADYFKRAGVATRLDFIPNSASPTVDETRNTFPSMRLRVNPLTPPMLGLDKFTSRLIGSPQNSWKGVNTTGWSTREYDQLVDVFYRTLDPNEGDGLMGQALTLLSNALPVMPLYFNSSVDAYVGSLRGPETVANYESRYTNMHQWEWQ